MGCLYWTSALKAWGSKWKKGQKVVRAGVLDDFKETAFFRHSSSNAHMISQRLISLQKLKPDKIPAQEKWYKVPSQTKKLFANDRCWERGDSVGISGKAPYSGQYKSGSVVFNAFFILFVFKREIMKFGGKGWQGGYGKSLEMGKNKIARHGSPCL